MTDGAHSTHATRVRLQKFLSDAGVASRRHAEELILEGRVLVNNEVVDTLPAFVDPWRDVVVAAGARVRTLPNEYFLVHKPRGVVCTNLDPAGRRQARDLLPPDKRHLFVAGRLDAESTGLLLMTNDGELAARLTHARFGVPKVYRAELRGRAPLDLPEQMRRGVYLAEGRARIDDVTVLHRDQEHSVIELTLRESHHRQLQRMLARLGCPLRRLTRIRIGPLTLRGLPVGAVRRLSAEELAELRRQLLRPTSAPRAGHGSPAGKPRHRTRAARGAPPKHRTARDERQQRESSRRIIR